MIGSQARAPIHRVEVATLPQNVLFGSPHEEGRTEREHEEAPKIDITPIPDVERAGLGKGSLDLVIVNLNQPLSLLMNQNKDGNWLVVKLIGDQSNKSGIGARVVLDIFGRRLIREVRGASSYYSSSGLRLHFGLGEAQRVDALEVFWPSGKVGRFDDLAANRVLVIREKEGLTAPPLRDKADATKQVRSPP